MNRTYKVIWSKARRCYVVVSELAKGQHKSSSKSEHISSNVHRGYLGKAALAAVVASLLTFSGLVYSPVMAAESVTDTDNNNTITSTDSKKATELNANITGKDNKVTDSSNAEIVGDNNTVTNKMEGRGDTVRSNDVRIHGSGNFISGSRNQQVIGDNNKIIARDRGTVTDYQHPEGREENVSDLTIGRGNVIQSNDTYRNEWDSLKVIGNNNRADWEWDGDHAGGPSAGIVIGDNQNLNGIQDTIVIGSLAPSEQQKKTEDNSDLYTAGSNNIIIGYHTTTTQHGGIVIGNRSQGSGIYQTIMGPRSIIGSVTGNPDSGAGTMASIYGAFNKIEDAGSSNDSGRDIDGLGNSVNGSLNITSNARGTMIMGVGNTVTHAKGPDILGKDEDTPSATGYWVASGLFGADYYAQGADTVAEGNNLNISYDEMRNAWQKYMETSGGAVSVLGNSNNADYAIRSQILGTGNTITGSEKNMSAYNTVSGFANTGTNIKRSAIVGTGNTLKNGEDNVVIGDYHNLENGKHNVILGSMDYTEKQVTKQSKSAWAMTDEHPDGIFEYTVTEQDPVKDHKKDIKNAVMVGYNTDATVDGGVALGSDSIASTEAGKTGYDAKGKKHTKSDKDYAAWVSTDAAVSVGGADREVTYDVLDKDGNPVKEKDGSIKTAKQTVKSTRQITNLAAGTEDTDAVNVAQMKVTATAAADAVKTHFYSVNSTDAKAGNYNNNGATGVNAIAAGVGASSDGDSSIAVGTNAKIESNGVSLTSIAIGKNAYVLNGSGNQEYQFSFDKDNWPDGKPNAKGVENLSGGIAIGTNTYARTGSIDVGGRTMKGRQMAGITIDKDGGPSTANIMDMTTVGTNSYNKGLMATIVGSYSINTGDFNGKGGLNSYFYGSQNMGSTIVGSLNQNRSLGKGGTSGVANSIIGVANVAEGANGALIFGAGNKVSNSIKSISGFDGNYGADTVDDLVKSLSSAVKDSESGGSTLVIGGGNTADYTQRTQIIGVNNTITGTSKSISDYNMVDGFNTTANNISHVYTIGYRNDFNNENNSVVIGDYHQLTNGKNNVVIGSYDGSYDKKTKKTTYLTNDTLEDAVILGHNANATVDGGVAIGADSVASTEAGIAGFDPKSRKHVNSDKDYSTWVATDAAVSVGGADREVKYKDKEGKDQTQIVKSTRQITNVAAGTQDTDAVNVAQLKAISSAINTDITASKTHFYSVNSTDEKAKNYDNKGATAANALAAGVGANADKVSAVAIGDTAYAGSANGVAIGTGSWIRSSDGKPNANGGDVAIGQDSHVDSYVNQGGSIALGQNARVENMFGNTEKSWAFGQTEFGADNIPVNPGNEAGGVAIGRNSFARTGSLMVGSHMYKGAIADMDEVDGTDSQKLRDNFNNINMTTLGTNSFNNGTFATVTGSYSATTAKKKTQNFAATVAGSLNSIESYKDADDNSGVASSIVGTANRIANSNNTTILGAGNEVTNSLADITAPTEGGASAKALQDTLKGKLQQDAKGAIVVSGIGNKVDSSHGVSVLGSKNIVNTTDNIQLLGDNREVTGATGSVIIGSADNKMITSVTDATILGHNANVEKAGGVALGAGSVASREAGVAGYDPATKKASGDTSATWKATNAAVSIGKEDGSMTRQITGVAAGTEATDAVNVAQLQKALDGAKDGNDTLKSDTNALKLDGNTLSMSVKDTAGNEVSGSVDLSKFAQAVDTNTTYTFNSQENKDNTTTITVKDSNGNENSVTVATKDTRNTVKAGENVTLDTKDNADGSHEYTVNVKADGKVEAGSTKIVSGGTVYNETRVAKDGNFVKQSNTAGENLTALDNQVTANTESIYHINNRVSDLDNRVNKVGAGAAALAALHPLDFDPDDKWDFAVGYGNYRNANSVAFGAFYRPNEDTMFSLGTNFGNGENMFNAGLSFKIGQGGSGITTSKTAMAKKIESLEDTVDKQDKKIAELEALVKEQGEMIRQYVGKK